MFRVGAAAEAHVDDLHVRTLTEDVVEPVENSRVASVARPQDLHRDDLRPGRDSARRHGAVRRNDSRHMCAVTVVIPCAPGRVLRARPVRTARKALGRNLTLLVHGIDAEAGLVDDVVAQVRMTGVDSGIEHGDADPGPGPPQGLYLRIRISGSAWSELACAARS